MEDDHDSFMRRKKIEQLKERKASLEATRSILRERSYGSTVQPTSRTTVRIPISSNDKESGEVKQQEYPSSLEIKSARSPGKGLSRTNDSDEKESEAKTNIRLEPSFERPPTKIASLGMSSMGDSQDGYMTDDSGIGRETVKKYKEYLQQDFQDERETQQMPSDRKGNRSENSRNSYDKYYSQLSKETTTNKWVVLKKKLGAPPPLEFNHVQEKTLPKDSLNEEQLIGATSIACTKRKMEQVKLESKKIGSQDLDILAGMLNTDDSEVELEAFGGLFSVVSGEDNQFVDYQSSDDDSNDVPLEEEKPTVTKALISAPKTMEVKSTLRDGGSETHLALTENAKNPAESEVEIPIANDLTSTHPEKTLRHLKNTKADQDSEGSSCNEEEPGRVSPLDSSVPHRHQDHNPSPLAERKYLVHSEKLRMHAGYDPVEGSSSHTEDNFSGDWEASVATETGSVLSRGNNPQILSFSAIPELDPSHDVSMSEQSSSVYSASENSSTDLMSGRYFPALHSGITTMIEVSSTESDSTDEELDFDKLAALEQYTEKDASVKVIPGHHFQTPESSKSQAFPRNEDNVRENIGVVNEREQARPDFQIEARKHHNHTDGVSGSGKTIATPQLWTVQKDSTSAVPAVNNGFNDLDTESIVDLEAPTQQDGYESGSADVSYASFDAKSVGEPPESRKETSDEVTRTARLKRETIFASGGPRFMCRLWVGLVILALFVIPIYFFVFSGAGSERDIASLNTSPTPAASTGPSPTLAPLAPVLAPVTGPMPTTALPTLTSISLAPTFRPSVEARPTTVRPTTPITMVPTEEGTTEAPPTIVRPSTSITLAPTFEATTKEPSTSPVEPTLTPAPTVEVTMGTLPAAVPTVSPITLAPQSCDRLCRLRGLLISVWSPLEDTLGGINTPQYSSLEWLAKNANYESYSDAQLIQRFALATLYFSAAGGRWRNNDLWLSDSNECTWYSGSSSATCDSNGSFIRLNLSLNNATGTLPSDIALLSNLIEIDFSTSGRQGSLSGAIPTELGKLQKLTSLKLRGNALGSTMPSGLGNCAEMIDLDLSQTGLVGSLPSEISGMAKLKFLSLTDNNLTGTVPSSIGALTNLQRFQLQQNAIGGVLPTEIGKLVRLRAIDVGGNRLTRIPDQLENLVLLEKMSFANNRLQGTIPSGVGNAIELNSLELQGNGLTGTIPTSLGKLTGLRDALDLSSNSLSGPIPSELGRLTFLRKMLLQDNMLTGQVPTTFSSLQQLTLLRLESNGLEGSVPESVCNVYGSALLLTFVADCARPKIECSCCTYCCQDTGECTCQYEGTSFGFLCADFDG